MKEVIISIKENGDYEIIKKSVDIRLTIVKPQAVYFESIWIGEKNGLDIQKG